MNEATLNNLTPAEQLRLNGAITGEHATDCLDQIDALARLRGYLPERINDLATATNEESELITAIEKVREYIDGVPGIDPDVFQQLQFALASARRVNLIVEEINTECGSDLEE